MAVTISRRSSYCPNFATAPFRVIWGQWREVVDQWTAVDAGVGVVCSSFESVGARRAGSRSMRRSSWAFRATTMVEADIKIAPTAGDSTNPVGVEMMGKTDQDKTV